MLIGRKAECRQRQVSNDCRARFFPRFAFFLCRTGFRVMLEVHSVFAFSAGRLGNARRFFFGLACFSAPFLNEAKSIGKTASLKLLTTVSFRSLRCDSPATTATRSRTHPESFS